jgi:hypothetical protein
MFVSLSPSDAMAMKQGIPTIIVPYRDNAEQERSHQLKRFVSHIHRYHPDWNVLIIEQSDDGRKFNRGALLNIGARFSLSDHIIFHDVDLLPLKKIVPYYTAFPENPIHIGKAWTEKYDSPNFLGGVLSISKDDLVHMNGFPNNFWGWGGEDDAFRNRLKAKKIDVFQPTLRGEGFTELKHVDSRTKTEWKNMQKWEDLKADSGRSGIRNVKYEIVEKKVIFPNAVKITVEIL